MHPRHFTHITALVMTLLLTSAALSRADTSLERGITYSEGGDLVGAETEFSTVPQDLRDFRISFRESQKVLYKKAAWDRFFGAATYYRKNLMTGFFEPSALALEILALIKHCQFDVAEKLIASEQSMVAALLKPSESQMRAFAAREVAYAGGEALFQTELKKFQAQLDSFGELLRLQQQIPKAVNTKDVGTKVKAFTSNLEWNISQGARDAILSHAVKNIRAVRLYVKDACTDQPVAGIQ